MRKKTFFAFDNIINQTLDPESVREALEEATGRRVTIDDSSSDDDTDEDEQQQPEREHDAPEPEQPEQKGAEEIKRRLEGVADVVNPLLDAFAAHRLPAAFPPFLQDIGRDLLADYRATVGQQQQRADAWDAVVQDAIDTAARWELKVDNRTAQGLYDRAARQLRRLLDLVWTDPDSVVDDLAEEVGRIAYIHSDPFSFEEDWYEAVTRWNVTAIMLAALWAYYTLAPDERPALAAGRGAFDEDKFEEDLKQLVRRKSPAEKRALYKKLVVVLHVDRFRGGPPSDDAVRRALGNADTDTVLGRRLLKQFARLHTRDQWIVATQVLNRVLGVKRPPVRQRSPRSPSRSPPRSPSPSRSPSRSLLRPHPPERRPSPFRPHSPPPRTRCEVWFCIR